MAKASKRSSYDDQVLDAASLHTLKNVYFIGPYARQVSFKSQQQRALDLVSALTQSEQIFPGARVAVIGAGLAGLTASVALAGENCKIDLLEQHDGLFRGHQKAWHRIVHPTISRWPLEPLAHTTEFPFLDWMAGPCSEIVASLAAHWEEYLLPAMSRARFRIDYGVKVVEIVTTSKGLKLGVRESDAASAASSRTREIAERLYDFVLVTTGFGSERTLPGLDEKLYEFQSYWQPDWLERNSDVQLSEIRRRSNEDSPVVISGCGDGALIDCLRFVHADFRGGWLAVEIAEAIGGAGAAVDIIIKAERYALIAAKSIRCLPKSLNDEAINTDYAAAVLGGNPSTKYTTDLADAYRAALDKLPHHVLDLMQKSISASEISIGRVKLVTPEEAPFVPYSAPIHKLMLAHAIEEGYVVSVRGKLEQIETHPHIRTKDASSPSAPSNAKLIVRHGAPSNLPRSAASPNVGLIAAHEAKSLELRQFFLADYIYAQQRDFAAPPDYPEREARAPGAAVSSAAANLEFAASRYHAARRMMDHFRRDVALNLNLKTGAFEYATVEPPKISAGKDGQERRYCSKLNPPKKLFGIAAEPVEKLCRAKAIGA